jgi:hypothetical protein
MTCGLKVNGCNCRKSCQMKLARIRNTKDICFPLYGEDRSKGKHIYKNKHDHIQTNVEHVCNSGTTLQNTGKEGK